MFVASNKLSVLKNYFYKKLELQFSPSELKLMFYESLAKRLGVQKETLLLDPDFRLSESDLLHIRTIAHRLLDGEPFQYIHGETEFFGLNLICDERALIPRPETEELVLWITESLDNKQEYSLLDFCTGSGCIALALKNSFQASKVIGIDVSNEALSQAMENATNNAIEVNFMHYNVLSEAVLPFQEESIDCIVSNPPYVLNKEKENMDKNVLEFEPHLALFVEDNDPLIFYSKIAKMAKYYLKNGGLLFFEINEQYGKEMTALLEHYHFKNIELKKDLQGKDRMIRARK